MIELVHSTGKEEGVQLLASTSCLPSGTPAASVFSSADFLLLHGNGQSPSGITREVTKVRTISAFKARPRPIVFNEDDHGNFGPNDTSNLNSALAAGASWGFLCCCDAAVQGDYSTGYQCPPVNWRMDSSGGDCLSGSQGKPMVRGSKGDWAKALQRITMPKSVAA